MKEQFKAVNFEKALAEKIAMQNVFVSGHGYPSSVLALLITYFEKRKEVKRND